MKKVVIIGTGPAGISAALYTVRAGLSTTIIGKDGGALQKTDRIENYYGFAQPISGAELLSQGEQQAARLGAQIIKEEVVAIRYADPFVVETTKGSYPADYVLLATGSPRSAPKIPGLKELEGRGVSYCAVCDAFFYRGKKVAVLGHSAYALHEVQELLPVAAGIILLTNGTNPQVMLPPEVQVDTRPISSLYGENKIEGVEFQQGDALPLDGLFVAYGSAGSTDLARKLGVTLDGNRILTDPKTMATNVPGIYAAGDCTGGLLQISKAVYEGALAGTSIIKASRA